MPSTIPCICHLPYPCIYLVSPYLNQITAPGVIGVWLPRIGQDMKKPTCRVFKAWIPEWNPVRQTPIAISPNHPGLWRGCNYCSVRHKMLQQRMRGNYSGSSRIFLLYVSITIGIYGLCCLRGHSAHLRDTLAELSSVTPAWWVLMSWVPSLKHILITPSRKVPVYFQWKRTPISSRCSQRPQVVSPRRATLALERGFVSYGHQLVRLLFQMSVLYSSTFSLAFYYFKK